MVRLFIFVKIHRLKKLAIMRMRIKVSKISSPLDFSLINLLNSKTNQKDIHLLRLCLQPQKI